MDRAQKHWATSVEVFARLALIKSVSSERVRAGIRAQWPSQKKVFDEIEMEAENGWGFIEMEAKNG